MQTEDLINIDYLTAFLSLIEGKLLHRVTKLIKLDISDMIESANNISAD